MTLERTYRAKASQEGRESGVLLHISSLPGAPGIGTIGAAAFQVVETLASAHQKWWQMLPVGPTGFGDSPYQSPSTFAGNHLLIDLDRLMEQRLLNAHEVESIGGDAPARIDYGRLWRRKPVVLAAAADRFLARGGDDGYNRFRTTPWLDDYVMFAALKESYDQRPWIEWDEDLALRRPRAMADAKRRLSNQQERHRAIQYFFHTQWEELRSQCRRAGIGLIGDLPIFVAHDSADVWAAPHLFQLDDRGRPKVVAGVPPDYFSETGQRWGNPLYRWEVHHQDSYRWWVERLRASFHRFDRLRIDHFRGFSAYWEIPASARTAAKGRWLEGPGDALFDQVSSALGPLPIIAEDLGIITEEVTRLRRRFGFPGMRVAQFGFDEELDTAIHNPANYPEDVVAYTGTHDNDTAVGWFWGDNHRHDRRRLRKHRRRLLKDVGTKGNEIHWDLIRLVMGSAASLTVTPVQDLLGLGSNARMNTPGVEGDNWTWRMKQGALNGDIAARMAALTVETGRG